MGFEEGNDLQRVIALDPSLKPRWFHATSDISNGMNAPHLTSTDLWRLLIKVNRCC